MKTKTIYEFEKITSETFGHEYFNKLLKYIYTNNCDKIFRIEYRNTNKYIKVLNYLGIIMIDDFIIEILPKVGNDDSNKRSILVKMIHTLTKTNYSEHAKAMLKIKQTTLLDIFIKRYLDNVSNLVKRGLQSNYQTIEENTSFYKGKLLTNIHIQKNNINKHQFYVSYDDFNTNTINNQLIKSCLVKLIKLSPINSKQITILLGYFDNVDIIYNYHHNLTFNRTNNHYKKVVNESLMYLNNLNYEISVGNNSTTSLLFPAEVLFESYVGYHLTKIDHNFTLKLQDNKYYLFKDMFRLIPDILLTNHDKIIIMDTKYKKLDDTSSRSGVSQADIYQMYAYAKKYDTNHIYILYPKHIITDNSLINSFKSDEGIIVSVYQIDILEIEKSLSELVYMFYNVGC